MLWYNPKVFTGTFAGCENLKQVVIRCDPHLVTARTFTDCGNLKDIVFEDPRADLRGIWLENGAEDYVIWGNPGSTAEAFAKDQGMTFSPMESVSDWLS